MKKSVIYIFLAFIPATGFSQEISVQVEYPSVVEAGEQFAVSWSVNSGGGEFIMPSFKDFHKLMGPNTSYSSSMQVINGKVSQQVNYSYLCYFQAVREGKYTIPPATYTFKNKTYYSDSLHIEVIAGNSRQPATNWGEEKEDNGNSNVETGGKNLFLDLSLNRNSVYLGEHFFASVKIYTKIELEAINEIKYPSFNGFLKTDLETPQLNSLKRENINGTIYGTGVIQQFLLYPQVAGQITIDPVQVNVSCRQKVDRTDPFFGDFFPSYQSVPRAVASKPVTINVKPLPGIKPDDFSGLVGKINIRASILKDSVDVNDALNFRIVIAGTANMRLAEVPALKLPPDIEIFDPKITDNIKNGPGGTTGQKTFDFLLIPRHHGDFAIPAVTYSYFNTSTGKYERLSTGELRFHVRKGSEQENPNTMYIGSTGEDVKYVGKDIRFIRRDPGNLDRVESIILGNRSFIISYFIILLVFIAVIVIRREHVRRNSDLSAVRNRKAGRAAVKRLRYAADCMKSGRIDSFHEEILKAVWGYLSDKLNIPVSELARNNALAILSDRGISDDDIASLESILDKCEYARYAPSSSDTGVSGIYDVTSKFIRAIENKLG